LVDKGRACLFEQLVIITPTPLAILFFAKFILFYFLNHFFCIYDYLL
jgi:hypothetical protein